MEADRQLEIFQSTYKQGNSGMGSPKSVEVSIFNPNLTSIPCYCSKSLQITVSTGDLCWLPALHRTLINKVQKVLKKSPGSSVMVENILIVLEMEYRIMQINTINYRLIFY